jgi:hypothetical protein
MKRLEMYRQAGPSPVNRAIAVHAARLRMSACAAWMPAGHGYAFAARTGPWVVPI